MFRLRFPCERLFSLVVFSMSLLSCTATEAQRIEIPRRHEKPPGSELSPAEAVAKMTVPDGFTVEIVAAEPDIVHPVAMAIDERGRFWITESLEYPRKSPGPGRDRVKVLEDTTGDGKANRVTVFLDGLNIPGGIAVGHGGVWIVNSADILFVPDADRDAVPDGPPQIVVTGLGRRDTHEPPNSLTWGPDGWLYGLNGDFNPADVRYPKSNPNFKHDHPGFQFDAAMFRIHPKTREFHVFARGTSNPRGIAFNNEGEAFISASGIDHLWHITKTGYYHRQVGAYPPFTWPIDSIVDHKHQPAAYCGIHYFDSDAYPENYRRKLYRGNIDRGCVSADRIQKNGSTYTGFGEPDLLTANDAWFTPVVQKTGPDGSLYILDSYDRDHSNQDANEDLKGIVRAKGHLYRVRYKDTPRKWNFDFGKSSDDELIELLRAPNDYARWTATRLLQERRSEPVTEKLQKLVFDSKQTPQFRLHALWIAAASTVLDDVFLDRVMQVGAREPDGDSAALRAWSLRLLGEKRTKLRPFITSSLWDAAVDPANEVRLQVAIALASIHWQLSGDHVDRMTAITRMETWFSILIETPDDTLISRIIWQNLHPRLEKDIGYLVEQLDYKLWPGDEDQLTDLIPRIADRVIGRKNFDAQPVADLFMLLRDDHPQIACRVLDVLSAKLQSGELQGERLEQLKTAMALPLLADDSEHVLSASAATLAASWGNE